ncbi:DUF4157 domain-containing protein [Massilia sp. CFBP9026]|uniref:eCIS core domain-containing protein n=1 Tax=Massilia sp. CFBP9026 TaxID=3096536 RepID=UPI002A6B84E4|nr:DUF4157 domain-containing protein [Massilia sp. CFBP9026]MDY0962676.1 DUF4157 domain-containing protein [Massilia sp. CFBP9026]
MNADRQQLENAARPPVQQRADSPPLTDSRVKTAELARQQALAQASPRVARLHEMADLANAVTGKRMNHAGSGSGGAALQRVESEAHLNETGMPDQLKAGIESLSGMDMSAVRVHRNSGKPAQLEAHGYAQGTEIHLAPGQDRHLAHEAWHVVQQMQGRVKPTMQLKGGSMVNDAPELEREADLMGEKAATGTFLHDGRAHQLRRQGYAIDAGPRMPAQRVKVAGAGIVQRVTAQILEGTEEGVIDGIAIVGRPPHIFGGTMGDHSSAFVTTVAGLQAQLKETNIDQAAVILYRLSQNLDNVPGVLLIDSAPQAHRDRWHAARAEMETIWGFLMPRMMSRLHGGGPAYDQHDAAHIQRFAEAFLEARELVPLSTINTKAINAPLAGKGKGESARALVHANAGQAIPLDTLVNTVVGLFDARSAAVVCSITDQAMMDKVAPGMRVAVSAEQRALAMIKQHLWTIDMMYPSAAEQVRPGYDGIITTLLQNITQKMDENAEVQRDGVKVPGKRGGNNGESGQRYLASSISLHDDGRIRDVSIEGRTTSPFSGTMGAHTTAWTVLIDRMRNQLESSPLAEAAQSLLEISEQAQEHLYAASEKFQADTKQLVKLSSALSALGAAEKKLKRIVAMNAGKQVDRPIGPFQQLLTIQEAINCVLDLQNLTPGATLYVGNTNGAREGHYRGILLKHVKDGVGTKVEVRAAVLGLMDLKGLDQHRATIGQSIRAEMKDPQRQEAESGYYQDLLMLGTRPTPGAAGAELQLLEHHLEMVEEAYPGAVAYAGIDINDDTAVNLIIEAAAYAADEGFELDED